MEMSRRQDDNKNTGHAVEAVRRFTFATAAVDLPAATFDHLPVVIALREAGWHDEEFEMIFSHHRVRVRSDVYPVKVGTTVRSVLRYLLTDVW